MDLAALQMFQMVATERSYSRAAAKLFRTQPAISIAMRKLEDWVGEPLFVRGSGARHPHRCRHAAAGIRRAHAEHARGNSQRVTGTARPGARSALPGSQRKLHPRAAARAGALPPPASRGSHSRPPRVLARSTARAAEPPARYRCDLLSCPRNASSTTAEFYRDALVLVVWPGHRLGEAPRRGHHRARARKLSSPTSSNRPIASASSNYSPSTKSRCAWKWSCPPSKASSASCKWIWAWPSCRACASKANWRAEICANCESADAHRTANSTGVPAGSAADGRRAGAGGHYSFAQESAVERRALRKKLALGGELIERCAYARKSFAHVFGLPADADAEMLRRSKNGRAPRWCRICRAATGRKRRRGR